MSAAEISTLRVVGSVNQDGIEKAVRIPRLEERITEELVIALVGPVGSGCTETYKQLDKILGADYGYQVYYYKLSDFISREAPLVGEKIPELLSPAQRIDRLQSIGDKLRETHGNAYLAASAIKQIAALREKEGFDEPRPNVRVPKKLRQIHVIDSIKHPEELRLLRSTYGDILWLIGVFAPLEVRNRRLRSSKDSDESSLSRMIQRDYCEEGDRKHGQDVRAVFHQADFFVRNEQENTKDLKESLERFLEIIFGWPVHTPTRDESLMYAAHAEAAKSACLSRQVGAAIASEKGELIGLGRNDVPKYDGGLYTEEDGRKDHRCHAWQEKCCHNDKMKGRLYQQIFEKLRDAKLLAPEASQADVAQAVKKTDVKRLIEYSRAVHAEMDAITAVARTHKAGLLGGTLYVTTYPCHSCARHIVASGIHKVVFIEPYPKSLATDLHYDAVSENENEQGKVVFLQFSGMAPKNILKLFNIGLTRKGSDGTLTRYDKKTASPVVKVSLDDYPTHEQLVVAELPENEERTAHR